MLSVESKIINILENICKTDEISADLDMELFDYGYLDSLDVVELLTRVEEELKVKINISEIIREEISTPNKIIEFVKTHI
nr:D-alanine--poly(phosphoribitol) ligase subunit DltC [Clostridium beijerinckii]